MPKGKRRNRDTNKRLSFVAGVWALLAAVLTGLMGLTELAAETILMLSTALAHIGALLTPGALAFSAGLRARPVTLQLQLERRYGLRRCGRTGALRGISPRP